MGPRLAKPGDKGYVVGWSALGGLAELRIARGRIKWLPDGKFTITHSRGEVLLHGDWRMIRNLYEVCTPRAGFARLMRVVRARRSSYGIHDIEEVTP